MDTKINIECYLIDFTWVLTFKLDFCVFAHKSVLILPEMY